MNSRSGIYPAFPPGLWRRVVLHPENDWIGGALEDDMHRFHIRIDHAGERITRVAAKAVRHPWSACPGAVNVITRELTGELLDDVGRRDPTQHCTHLLDLAILAAARAGDSRQTVFDMKVADRIKGHTIATLAENGEQVLRWRLDDTLIAGTGRDLRQFSRWKQELPPREAGWATLLRRAAFVSGARQYVAPPLEQTAAMNAARMGICFNYQLPQAEGSMRKPSWQMDFSESGREPLEGFDAEAEFRAMAGQG